MRILLLAGYYPPDIVGGGEISTQTLAEALFRKGVDVRILTCGHMNDAAESQGPPVERIKSPNIYWRYGKARPKASKAIWHALENYNPRTLSTLTGKIAEYSPDVLMTSTLENFGAAAWLAGARAGIPVVHILRSYYLRCWRGTMFKGGRNCVGQCPTCRVLSIGKKHLSRFVDGVVGISNHILDDHVQSGYFPNAQPIRIFNPVSPPKAARARAFDRDNVVFGYLGAIQPSKGVEPVVRLFSGDEVRGRLLLAGRGEPRYVDGLRSVCDRSRVEFLGWVEPDTLFQAIDYLICPSAWNEPFGRVVAEAMTHGIPVIGSRRGGIAEIIDDGSDGFLYDPEAPDDLRRAIQTAAAAVHRYSEMSSKALAKAGSFAPDRVAGAYLDLLAGILSRR